MIISEKRELIMRDVQSILQYGLFIWAQLIVSHVTWLTDRIVNATHIDVEVVSSIMAFLVLILRKYVISKTYTK